MNEADFEILMQFLSYPLDDSEAILELFAGLDENSEHGRPVRRINGDKKLEQFVWIPGKRKSRVVLVAHSDTRWDREYELAKVTGNRFILDGKFISSAGIGSDGRAGCAILWQLKDLGHSLLITNGEAGNPRKNIAAMSGSGWLKTRNKDIMDEINRFHQFAIQFDCRNSLEFKCYEVGTAGFRQYVREETGYRDAGRDGSKDINVLCRDICGVNLSVGFDKENTSAEILNAEHWNNTLSLCREWISEPDLPRFELHPTSSVF